MVEVRPQLGTGVILLLIKDLFEITQCFLNKSKLEHENSVIKPALHVVGVLEQPFFEVLNTIGQLASRRLLGSFLKVVGGCLALRTLNSITG